MGFSRKHTEKLLRDFKGMRDNPYVFSMERIDDAAPRERESVPRLPHEEEILREQRRTIFESDRAMQKTFEEDFEAYSAALDNPDIMIERLEERMHEIQDMLEEHAGEHEEISGWWQEEFWGDEEEAVEEPVDDLELVWEDDELYQRANKWAHRLFKVGNKLYDEKARKDPDLFRVLVNIFLVPAKIVYASSSSDETGDAEFDEVEIEVSLQGYTLAMAFLRRVRESLVALVEKRFEPLNEWRAAIMAADEIALEIQGRMIALAKSLKKGDS